ncbi:hypothetical protein GU334_00740 [Lactococcus raffinolactis]|uniref:BIG2 domain-containing protein n=1 Tax=Pseudolactococcus raffinolactis TaxID=1366 RepID=A0AAE6YK42_9LACT|nr:MucBP domain-containing protein [Lactococcus raffinolactis]QIW57536.1 hypothetical protein GU334_00740 [Lactococcus raffinolactis]
MRGNKMRYSVLICIVASLLAFLLVLLPANIQATVDHDTSVAIPDTTSESGTWPVVNSVTPGFNKPYRESTVSYKGKANYYFATGDTTYTNGQTVYVTFDGATGTVATTGTANGDTVFQAKVILLPDTNGDGEFEFTNQLSGTNRTVFVDAGTYIQSLDVTMANFTSGGPAIIGLTDFKGANPVVIKRTPVLKGSASGGVTNRYHYRQVIQSGTMLQNIVFDADGYGMVKDGALAATQYATVYTRNGKDSESNITWGTTGNISTGNRGTAWFVLTDYPEGNLIKNCTIQNLGTSDGTPNPNYAINIIQGTKQQINLENLVIKNNRGATSDSFRLINIGPASNINIKDITFDKGASTNRDQDLIWQEAPGTATGIPAGTEITATEQISDVLFAGDFNVIGYTRKRIGSQLTTYKNLTVPESFRYVAYSVGTTATNWSGSTTAADIHVYQSLNDFEQGWANGDAANDNRTKKVIFDLADNSWVVRVPKAGAVNQYATVDQQLMGISRVLQRFAASFPTTGTGGSGRNLITDVNIKLVADTDGYVPDATRGGFTKVPTFSVTSSAPNIHIRAVKTAETLFYNTTDDGSGLALSGVKTDGMLTSDDQYVPVRSAFTLMLDPSIASNVRLYGFDFHEGAYNNGTADIAEGAHYTLHEAIHGISTPFTTTATDDVATTHLNEAVSKLNRDTESDGTTEKVPRTTAAIVNATKETFAQSRFTALVKDLKLTLPTEIKTASASLIMAAALNDDNADVNNNGILDSSEAKITLLDTQAPFTPTVFTTTAYTHEDVTLGDKNGPSEAADDIQATTLSGGELIWQSSDPTVATVDPTGQVSVLAAGNTVITAVVRDTYNQGEIERPHVMFGLNIQATYQVKFAPGEKGSWQTTDTGYHYSGITGDKTLAEQLTVGAIATPSSDSSYVFGGWYLDSNANGVLDANETTAYDGAAVIDADRQYVAKWEKYEVTFAPGLYGAWTVSDSGYNYSGFANGDTMGSIVTIANIATPSTSGGAVFAGWVLDANHNGVIDEGETTLYSDTDAIDKADANNGQRQYIAKWNLLDTTVVVHYISDTGETLHPDIVLSGQPNSPYTTEQKEFANYDFVSVTGGEVNDFPMWSNSPKEVTYIYTLTPTELILRYVDEAGNLLTPELRYQGKPGTSYTTQAKTFPNYTLKVTPDNASGQYPAKVASPLIVTYVYEKNITPPPGGEDIPDTSKPSSSEQLPKTGEKTQYLWYVLGVVIFIICLLIKMVDVKRKNQDKSY